MKIDSIGVDSSVGFRTIPGASPGDLSPLGLGETGTLLIRQRTGQAVLEIEARWLTQLPGFNRFLYPKTAMCRLGTIDYTASPIQQIEIRDHE